MFVNDFRWFLDVSMVFAGCSMFFDFEFKNHGKIAKSGSVEGAKPLVFDCPWAIEGPMPELPRAGARAPMLRRTLAQDTVEAPRPIQIEVLTFIFHCARKTQELQKIVKYSLGGRGVMGVMGRERKGK